MKHEMKELTDGELTMTHGGWSFDNFALGLAGGYLASLLFPVSPIVAVVVGAAIGGLEKSDLDALIPDPNYIDYTGDVER